MLVKQFIYRNITGMLHTQQRLYGLTANPRDASATQECGGIAICYDCPYALAGLWYGRSIEIWSQLKYEENRLQWCKICLDILPDTLPESASAGALDSAMGKGVELFSMSLAFCEVTGVKVNVSAESGVGFLTGTSHCQTYTHYRLEYLG